MAQIGIATGGGRGMGFACAQGFVGMVDVLLIVDIDDEAAADAAEALSRQAGADVRPFPLDITDRDGLDRLASTVSDLGVLRAVSHAAGISPTMADWERVLTVDLVGTAALLETLAPLATDGTAVVCFASMAPYLGGQGVNAAADAAIDEPLDLRLLDRIHDALGSAIEDSGQAYTWAKRGVHRLVQREAFRYGRAGGRVCSLSPGIIDTPMGQLEFEAHPMKAKLVEGSPFGRVGRPEEVAATVAFLLSDEASFINGIDVLVDGGLCASVAHHQR